MSDADSNGFSLLHHAVMDGQLEIVKCIAKKGLSVSDADANGFTALMHASSVGHLAIAKYLVAKCQSGLSTTYHEGNE